MRLLPIMKIQKKLSAFHAVYDENKTKIELKIK